MHDVSKCNYLHLDSFLWRETKNFLVEKLSFEGGLKVENNERENIVRRNSGHGGSEGKCRGLQCENLVLSRM